MAKQDGAATPRPRRQILHKLVCLSAKRTHSRSSKEERKKYLAGLGYKRHVHACRAMLRSKERKSSSS